MQQLFEPLTPYTQYYDYLLQKYSATSAVDKESFLPLLKELEDAISTLLIQILSQDDDGSVNYYYDALKVLTVMYGRVQEAQGAGSTNIGATNSINANAGVNGASIPKVNGGISPNSSVMNGGTNHAVDNSVIQLSDPNILNVNAPTVLGSLGGGQYVKNHSTAALAIGLTTGNGSSYATNLANSHPGNHGQGHLNGHGYNHTTSTASGLLDNGGGNASSQLLNASNAGVNTAGGNPAATAPTATEESLELHDMYDPVPVSANSALTVNGLLHHQQQHQPQHYHRQPQNHHHMPLQVTSQHQHHSQQHQQIQHLPTPQQHSHHHSQQPQQQTYYYPLNYSNTNTSTTAVQPSSTHPTSNHNGTNNNNNNNTSSNNNLRYYQQNLGSTSSFNNNSPAATNGGHNTTTTTSNGADYNQQQYFYTLQRYPYLPPIPSQHHNGPSASNPGHNHHASGGGSANGGTASVNGGGPGFQSYLLDFNFTN
ncbi:hypothetical protein D0Z00_000704 [Geotrichum galactomycetum]|uniref:Uncharacterized protein n=1 Tax=Geotrichum galactomycetum TaxID=27317 RepID=A0ACB6V964_9ASCO|nr:hypothetical protein D0Z00_000704 [Geotrichum candidum]